MTGGQIESVAFCQAQLRSERIRITAILAALAALALFILLRLAWLRKGAGFLDLIVLAAFFAVALAYERFMLQKVNRALQTGMDPGFSTWLLNVLVETLFPTAGLSIAIVQGFMSPYLALVAPAVLVYFIFIILSTLRLQPLLSVLTGTFSAAGYLAVAGYVLLRFPRPVSTIASLPVEFYLTYTFIILLSGLIAGQVAKQIRQYVNAAIEEAHHVERLKSDLEIARSIQQGLLPEEPPQTVNFQIAGWNKPADQTGGDYYGWQQLPNNKIAITLADVAGHGIGSALVAAACHAYSRAAMEEGRDLGSSLTQINRLLSRDLPSGKLVTFVAGLLSPENSGLELLSAGHGPLFLYTASDDRLQSFGAHGIPFGVLSSINYGPAQELSLCAGDLLVLITDGFFEWTNADDEEFGLDRLKEAIRASKDLPPAQIIRKLYDAVIQFSNGTEQQDDLTALIVKCNA
jgi:serine phosphatase RsbU (regulator of sigma subunit)